MKLYNKIEKFLKKAEKPLIVLLGPTASGKTALSIEIAKKFNGEIISADSRQIYKHLNIGTAKIRPEEMERIPHHGLDLREPNESFTVAEFKDYAEHLIEDIYNRGHLPILVGGTGLYINAITQNYDIPRVPPQWEFRKKLEKIAEKKGIHHLYQNLQKIDPNAAEKIHPNNLRYIIRALEINKFTKQQKKDKKLAPKYDTYEIGINWPREELYQKINERVHQQIKDGLIEEVKNLMTQGYNENLPAISSLGCKEFFPYLRGEITLEQAIDLTQRHTRSYARRQLVWFRRDKNINWLSSDELNEK